jgi:hypothetical protein
MSPPEALALVALTFAACALHAAVGFGSGPLLMPLLLTLTTSARAVVAAVGVGMVVNVLQLVAERRRPRPPLRTLWPLLAAALPGAALGALVADRLDHRAVAVALAVALLACGVALIAAPRRLPPPALAAGGAVAGFSAALTGVFGPALGVMVIATGGRGDALRDGIGRELPRRRRVRDRRDVDRLLRHGRRDRPPPRRRAHAPRRRRARRRPQRLRPPHRPRAPRRGARRDRGRLRGRGAAAGRVSETPSPASQATHPQRVMTAPRDAPTVSACAAGTPTSVSPSRSTSCCSRPSTA